MAWLSSGSSNGDLCRQLQRFNILDNECLLRAFLATDRGDFIPEAHRNQAYLDSPFKVGPIHLSAPHMYAQVLKTLDLQPGATFLNVGSGTGYLSCLAACLLGEQGVSHGIEISPEVCSFSEQAIARWKARLLQRQDRARSRSLSSSSQSPFRSIRTVSLQSTSSLEFEPTLSTQHTHDTQATEQATEEPLTNEEENTEEESLLDVLDVNMLESNGVLVVPVIESHALMCITRRAERVFTERVVSRVHYAPLLGVELCPLSPLSHNAHNAHSNGTTHTAHTTQGETAHIEADYESEREGEGDSVLPTALFSPALPLPRSESECESHALLRLPAVLWAPQRTRHRQFPAAFRETVRALLMASNRSASHCEGRCVDKRERVVCAMLPQHVWLTVFTFMSRGWFERIPTENETLRAELEVEREMRLATERRLKESEAAQRSLRIERDILQDLLQRMGVPLRAQHLALAYSLREDVHPTLEDSLLGSSDEEGLSDGDDARTRSGSSSLVLSSERESERENERESERESEDASVLDIAGGESSHSQWVSAAMDGETTREGAADEMGDDELP